MYSKHVVLFCSSLLIAICATDKISSFSFEKLLVSTTKINGKTKTELITKAPSGIIKSSILTTKINGTSTLPAKIQTFSAKTNKPLTVSTKVPSTVSSKVSSVTTKRPSSTTKGQSSVSTKVPSTVSSKVSNVTTKRSSSTTKGQSSVSTKVPSSVTTKRPISTTNIDKPATNTTKIRTISGKTSSLSKLTTKMPSTISTTNTTTKIRTTSTSSKDSENVVVDIVGQVALQSVYTKKYLMPIGDRVASGNEYFQWHVQRRYFGLVIQSSINRKQWHHGYGCKQATAHIILVGNRRGPGRFSDRVRYNPISKVLTMCGHCLYIDPKDSLLKSAFDCSHHRDKKFVPVRRIKFN